MGKKKTNNKVPADYPIFGFRIQEKEKEWLNETIDDVLKLYNESLAVGEPKRRRNHLILEALGTGLSDMTKQLKEKKRRGKNVFK